MQNAGRSYNTGLEVALTQNIKKRLILNLSANAYQNSIEAFTVENKYPIVQTYSAERKQMVSGNFKVNISFHFQRGWDLQLASVYLAPDIIPQGKTAQRYSLDIGVKKSRQKGRGELYMNASDLLNTMVVKKEIKGNGFTYVSADYYETQVIRIGYNYKF